jgi:hypothetical protein
LSSFGSAALDVGRCGLLQDSDTHSFGGLLLVRQVTNVSAIGLVPAQSIKMDIIGGAFEKVTVGNPGQGSEVDVVSYGSCVVSTRVSGQPATPSRQPRSFWTLEPSP